MVEFYSTRSGRKYYENHVPRIASALEKIAVELEKLNEDKGLTASKSLEQEDLSERQTLEQIADEIAPFEPAFARLLKEHL